MQQHILWNIITLIATAVFIVAVFKRLKLSPVLGYLVAGAVIGDHGFKIVTFAQTNLLAEFGVVFLLFAIGLELSFERLKVMRRYVFGMGSLQVFITAVVIAAATVLISNNPSASIIIGGGLALSSTAIVMQVLEENRSQSTQIGRVSLAILLMQDFIVVPLLVMVPLLSGETTGKSLGLAMGSALLKAVLALFAIFVAGRLLLRPLFRFISSDSTEGNDLAISLTLLIVLSAAVGTEYFGLSLALGAFVAGVLVAETEFRLQAEESIYPFKSLLLGLFFMTVGMQIDVKEIYENISNIITLSIALITVKTLIISALCVLFGFNKGTAIHTGLLLSQGGEFAFILFGLGKETGIIEIGTANILLLVVTCTMALTPLLAIMGQKIAEKIEYLDSGKPPLHSIEIGARDLINHVIIAGFGKVGKMVARVLEAEGINYIALDVNDDIVNDESSEGFPVFKGDVSHLDTLRSVGAERALTLILAMNNEITIKKALRTVSNNFPDLEIILRLKNLKKASEFYENGATIIVPEDYETGLQLGGAVLKSVGISEQEINRIKGQFRSGNYIIAKKDYSMIEFEEHD